MHLLINMIWPLIKLKMVSFIHANQKIVSFDLFWSALAHQSDGIPIFGVNKVHINKTIWHFWFQFEMEMEKNLSHLVKLINLCRLDRRLVWLWRPQRTSIATSRWFDHLYFLLKWCHYVAIIIKHVWLNHTQSIQIVFHGVEESLKFHRPNQHKQSTNAHHDYYGSNS